MRIRTRLAGYLGLVLPFAMIQGGCTNVLSFSTATKFGLDIAQQADQTIDVSMGYDRAEVASIPVPKNEEATAPPKETDACSVLGTFKVKYGNPFREPLVLDQFFATGWAARAAAKNPVARNFFGKQAHDIASKRPGGE